MMFGYSPIWLLNIALAVFFAIHAGRSGRTGWIFIILFFPGLGSLIYFILEYLPEIRSSRRTRRVAGKVAETFANTIDPGKRLRETEARYKLTPSFANRHALGELYLELGRVDEAIALFEENTRGVHSNDPASMRGLAQAWFKKGDMEKAKDFILRWRERRESSLADQMDLLYAEVLVNLRELTAAVEEFQALAKRTGSEEYRYRAAVLLRELQREEEARAAFKAILDNAELLPSSARKAQKRWIEAAAKELERK